MRKKYLFLLLFSLFSLFSCSQNKTNDTIFKRFKNSDVEYPLSVKMKGGKKFILKEKAKRLLSLTLQSDEILLSICDPKDVFGVSYLALDEKFSNVPERAKKVKNILKTDAEMILSYEPDVVFLASYVSKDVLNTLNKGSRAAFVLPEVSSIKDIERNIYTIGSLAGERKKAYALIKEMRGRLNEISENVSSLESKKGVIFLTLSGWTAGKGSSADTIIRLAGARNLADKMGVKGHAEVYSENLWLLDNEIDYIITSEMLSENECLSSFKKHNVYGKLSAVKEGRVISMDMKTFSSLSHFIVDAISELHYKLY